MNYINKSQVMYLLERGGRVVSHDCYHSVEAAGGDCFGFIRRNLWTSLDRKQLEQVGKEMRPPSRLPFFIYKLRNSKTSPA